MAPIGGMTMEYTEITAKTVNDAITKACMQLGLPSDRLDIQVVSEGSKGFLGIGSKPAVIKVCEKEVLSEGSNDKKDSHQRTRNKRRTDSKKKRNTKVMNVESEETRKVSENKREPLIKTEEEIMEIEKIAEKFLKDVFASMEMTVDLSMNYEAESTCLSIDLSGDDMGVLIGKRGQTLDSLQYLTGLVINKELKDFIRVKLDTEDYRRRRKETLENLAKNIASKVKKTGKKVVLEPMNPYERRIIHSVLQPNKYVETYSDGKEPFRHVVVVPRKHDKD